MPQAFVEEIRGQAVVKPDLMEQGQGLDTDEQRGQRGSGCIFQEILQDTGGKPEVEALSKGDKVSGVERAGPGPDDVDHGLLGKTVIVELAGQGCFDPGWGDLFGQTFLEFLHEWCDRYLLFSGSGEHVEDPGHVVRSQAVLHAKGEHLVEHILGNAGPPDRADLVCDGAGLTGDGARHGEKQGGECKEDEAKKPRSQCHG